MTMAQLETFRMLADTDMERYRVETFETKEPETLLWIDSIKPGDILHDVGANVGIYTLYAASRGVEVYAYEPVIENCCRLQENIEENGYKKARAYNVAVCGQQLHIENLYLPSTEVGASGGQIVSAKAEDGYYFKPLRTRTILALTLWEMFILEGFHFNFTNGINHHVKIDVDGHEQDVCDGMRRLLRGGCIHSVLVEVNQQSWPLDKARAFFREFGYTDDSHFNRCDNHSRNRRKGTKSEQAENVVFVRAQK